MIVGLHYLLVRFLIVALGGLLSITVWQTEKFEEKLGRKILCVSSPDIVWPYRNITGHLILCTWWLLSVDILFEMYCIALKTLFNIVEAPFKNCWILMSVLYDDV